MKRFTLVGIIILAALATAYYFLRPAPIDISLTGMRFPIVNCEIEKVRAGIKAGFDVNIRDEREQAPLSLAIMNGQTVSQRLATVKLLLEAGANPNMIVSSITGQTVLTEMIYQATNDVDCVLVEELLRAGAKTELKSFNDKTPLMYAANNDYTDAFAKLLIKYGANVNACDKDEFTPLMYALTNSNASPELVKALIAAGANVNGSSTNGPTPLYFAVKNPKASPDFVKTLIMAGADVNAVDNNSMSILDHAVSEVEFDKTNENKKVILRLLRQAGAKKRNWGGEEPDITPAK